MKVSSPGSVCALVVVLGTAWLAACSSDGDKPSPAGGGGDAAADGDVPDNTGGKPATGGKGGSAGSKDDAGTGGAGGTGVGGDDGGLDSSAAGGGTSAGGTPNAGGGTSDGGSDGGNPCANFRCQQKYPDVPYPPENPSDPVNVSAQASKAMLGKVLFWDEQLGELDTVACGTCHRAKAGGSDSRTTDPRAHLAGFDLTKDTLPGLTSDDIRGGMGVPACVDDPDGGPRVTDVDVQVTGRKPPTYFDAMFGPEIFWDGRAGFCKNGEANGGCFYDPDLPAGSAPLIKGVYDTINQRTVGGALEAQAVGPPTSSVEMACAGQTWADINEKLKNATPLGKAPGAVPPDMKTFIGARTYPQIFAAVYGTTAKVNAGDPNDVINTRRIAFAIATHERRLTSDQTPWDRWIDGDDTAMTDQQIRGWVAFMGVAKCGSCHAPPLFTDNSFHYIGFHQQVWDKGRGVTTGASVDDGKFKTPTLRNVGLREPFGLLHSGEGPGHDLVNVMSLYKLGGQRSDPNIGPFIDSIVEALPTLTQQNTDDIIEFLRNGLTDPRVKNETAPFDRPDVIGE